ncbi:CD209 antigen-like protein C isoform X2 [Pleurodeles waltl]|uniref:CD209 antigen-like protein C isoform X2 n=1 Tax=Pleurodeles waltl TaxID=8319 RepID=UPI00370998CA
MSAAPIYQDLKYQDSNVYAVLQEEPRKQQLPSRGGPTLQEVEDLEKKLRVWRIISVTVSLLIILVIILVVSIFFTQCNKRGADQTGLQKLKADICVNNAQPCTYCRSNWIFHSGNCYLFSIDSLNWTASRDNCRSMDSQLAIIENRDEETFIELAGQGPTWIGLSKADNGSWFWEDGTLLGQSFWQPGEPNNNVGSERCAEFFTVFYNSSGWNDSQCQQLKRRLCKHPAGLLSA